MCKTLLPLLLLLSVPVSVSAEVIIETRAEPLLEEWRARLAAKGESASAPGLTKATSPTDEFWFVPYFEVDMSASAFGNSTFWSVRNEGDVATTVAVDYYNALFSNLVTTTVTLEPNEVGSFNVRNVAGLTVDADGFARGMVRVRPEAGHPVVLDFFQVDAEENFATGSLAYPLSDFCTNWMLRFIGFGGLAGGSVMTVLANGPHGAELEDTPTVVGEVYSESGAFINSFTIRTDEWFFKSSILDLVVGDTKFGSVELVLDTTSSPNGVVSVGHSAFSLFSVGVQGVCQDIPAP
ncbi:MAG: hypothetical protein GY906_03790 [bacterium]|nr:hypothetical protein [bacterium]